MLRRPTAVAACAPPPVSALHGALDAHTCSCTTARGCTQEESGEDVMGQVMNSAKVAAWSWMAYLVDALEPRDLMTMARSAVVLPLCRRL